MLLNDTIGRFWKGEKSLELWAFFGELGRVLGYVWTIHPRRSIFPMRACAPSCALAFPAWLSFKSGCPSEWVMHSSHGARYPLLYNYVSLTMNYGALTLI